MVVHGCDGLDEATLTTETKVVEIKDGTLKSYYIAPEDFGLSRCANEELVGGDAEDNAGITRAILSGTERGPKRDVVVLNAALAFYMAGKGDSIQACIPLAQGLIDGGIAPEQAGPVHQAFKRGGVMTDILGRIAARSMERAEERKQIKPLAELKREAESLCTGDPVFPFEAALMADGIAFICEIKKASPSKGVLAEAFPYLEIAKEYEEAGAVAISVLTEPDWFLGKDEYLSEIKRNVMLPVLRKDFTVDVYQIYEAKTLGADAILLICALLDQEKLKEYIGIARGLELSVLVEVHTEAEVCMALEAGARIVGVNNRDLSTFEVDVATSIRLRSEVPDGILFVSESGISTPEDVRKLKAVGADAVLIGEAFMKSGDKKRLLAELGGTPGPSAAQGKEPES